MTERFLKLNLDTNASDFLARHYPYAFAVLSVIAMRARRVSGHSDGLIIGDAIIGSTDFPGMSRQNFRTALEKLTDMGHIKIVSNGKSFSGRERSTIKVTIKSNLVNLIKSDIYDINPNGGNQHINQQLTINKKEEERIKQEVIPQVPSFSKTGPDRDGADRIDDFSSSKTEVIPGVFLSKDDLETCLRIKGDIESVKEAIAFIQASTKRKHPIASWPNALSTWKIENKIKNVFDENLKHAQQLSQEFLEFDQGRGWRCYIYNDRKKDQRGLLFESQSPYLEPVFFALSDGEFQKKCEDFITGKNMRRKALIIDFK